MVILIYTADVSVGETAPSPTSPEPCCRKDTIRGGRVLDGGDACHVSEGESPAGVGVGWSELSRDEADTEREVEMLSAVQMMRILLAFGVELPVNHRSRCCRRLAPAPVSWPLTAANPSGPVFCVSERVSSRK